MCGSGISLATSISLKSTDRSAGLTARRAEERKVTMKTYIATFWRGNPQLPNGGYQTTRKVQARKINQARKLALKYETCSYGAMTLLDLVEANN